MTLNVDLASHEADVPSSMYGIFFEEINHAGDGGLYGEMLMNRSFEERVLPEGYTVEMVNWYLRRLLIIWWENLQ